jgi:hypothetical protein
MSAASSSSSSIGREEASDFGGEEDDGGRGVEDMVAVVGPDEWCGRVRECRG